MYSNGEPVAMSADGDTSYFGTDILRSVRSVTDKYGNVKAQYEYDAFGSPYLANLENDVGFGYCGKVYDSATGLYDYGFRDYAPNSARFTTVDPVRDGNNWFSYVVNDPVNYIDQFGLTSNDVSNYTYLGDKNGRSYYRAEKGATQWGLANDTNTPLNEVNGYDGVAESMPIGTILSIPSQINNSGTTPSNSNNAINTSPAITAQSFSQSSNFASVGMSGGNQNSLSNVVNGSIGIIVEAVTPSPVSEVIGWSYENRSAIAETVLGAIEIITGRTLDLFSTSLSLFPGFGSGGGGSISLSPALASSISIIPAENTSRKLIENGNILLNEGLSSFTPLHLSSNEAKDSTSNGKNINIPKNVERTVKKLSPEAKKGYEKALQGLKNGDMKGLNDHPLGYNRSGQRAIDIKGTGAGRGAGRLIYEIDSNGNINIKELILNHRY